MQPALGKAAKYNRLSCVQLWEGEAGGMAESNGLRYTQLWMQMAQSKRSWCAELLRGATKHNRPRCTQLWGAAAGKQLSPMD